MEYKLLRLRHRIEYLLLLSRTSYISRSLEVGHIGTRPGAGTREESSVSKLRDEIRVVFDPVCIIPQNIRIRSLYFRSVPSKLTESLFRAKRSHSFSDRIQLVRCKFSRVRKRLEEIQREG